MVLILLAWDSILWFTKSSFNFRRSSWQNSRYTIKIDWQAFFLLLDAIFVSFLNNLNSPKINQNFVYILIFGLVFITINSKIIWNKNILDSKKKNFASADNHLYIKSLHLWSQLMYWKKKTYHVVIVTKVAECLSIYKMECCHGDEIDEQANKNGGNDFWHKHTRQRLKTKHLFHVYYGIHAFGYVIKGLLCTVLNKSTLIYHLVIKNIVFTLMKNFLKVLAAPDWKIWLCLLAEPSGFLSSYKTNTNDKWSAVYQPSYVHFYLNLSPKKIWITLQNNYQLNLKRKNFGKKFQ